MKPARPPNIQGLQPEALYQVYLDKFVAQIAKSNGWQSISPDALSTMTELLQDFIRKIGLCAVKSSEHAGRALPSFYDMNWAINECGINPDGIPSIRSQTLPRIPHPQFQPMDKPPVNVRFTNPLPQPPYVPEHLTLQFPQPHTYIKTPTYNLPVSGYTNLRNARAQQKAEVLNSLSRQLLHSGAVQLIPGREDCAWAMPGTVDTAEYLMIHPSDSKVKKRKKKVSNNVYMQPPRSSWAGLFAA
eukprot:sb/3468958/